MGRVRRRRPAAVLAVMFGVSAGITVAALATADRVESSYDKLLVETDAPDVIAYCFECSRVWSKSTSSTKDSWPILPLLK